MRVALYLRCGNKNNNEEALDNINEQRKKLIEYCESNGWEVVSILQDIGSTADENRPGFEALRAVIASRATDYVLVTIPDRLVRSMREYMKLDGLAKANSVSILSL